MVTKRLTPKKGRKAPEKREKNRKWKVSPWLVATGLLLVAAGVIYPYFRDGRFASTGARIPDGARHFCVDVSHHNDRIVWDSLKVVVDRSGHTTKDLLHAKNIYPVSTVIIKATEGERMVDKRFDEYWTEAGKRTYTGAPIISSVPPRIPGSRRTGSSRPSSSDTGTFRPSWTSKPCMRVVPKRN